MHRPIVYDPMNTATITRLNQLNQDFYAEIASSFSSTRQYPWQSWEKFFASSHLPFSQQIDIADVGCGNGRLAAWFLEKKVQFQYFGCDSNEDLLAEVHKIVPGGQTEKIDLVESLLKKNFALSSQFDLICVFGVFHHIPSFALRHEFLVQLAKAAKPGSELWLTAWNPQSAFLDRQQVAQKNDIQPDQLEAGDEFLGWKDSAAIRYVHCLQSGEMESLLAGTPWKIQSQWQETERGERGNSCFLLQR